jgi:hypothetical protein
MMPSVAPDEMKNIPEAHWEEWCDLFSNDNHGRLVRIVVDDAPGEELLVEGAKLLAIDYDPPTKGNAFIISRGDDKNPTRHIANNPVQLWQGQDVNGLTDSVSIEDINGTITMVRLD